MHCVRALFGFCVCRALCVCRVTNKRITTKKWNYFDFRFHLALAGDFTYGQPCQIYQNKKKVNTQFDCSRHPTRIKCKKNRTLARREHTHPTDDTTYTNNRQKINKQTNKWRRRRNGEKTKTKPTEAEMTKTIKESTFFVNFENIPIWIKVTEKTVSCARGRTARMHTHTHTPI